MFGHHKQLMGLAVHPDDEMFATAGHDKNIALWRGHKMVFATQVGTHDTIIFGSCILIMVVIKNSSEF